jgi:hypothetical protein
MTDAPENTSELKQFIDRVLKVTPRYNDMFSNGVPGNGAVNVGADPSQNLQRAALQFAHAVRDAKTKPAEVERLALDLEGTLMVAATFELITEENIAELVETLHNITQKRLG